MLPGKSLFRGLAIAALLVQCGLAQQDRPAEELQTTDPQALKQLVLQSHAETRLALLDQFREDFHNAGLIPWAYDQICEAFEAAGQLDRALAAGERLLALDPLDIEIAQQGMKTAEKKEDAALLRKWAEIAERVADRVLASPRAGKSRMELARSVRVYTDYLAYSDIHRINDPATKKDQLEEFLQRRRNSVYRSAAEDLYLETWRQSGNTQKTLEAAQRILEQDDRNVTALTLVAESYLASETEPKKLVTYATRILALLDRQRKPEGVTNAEWSQRKALLTGRANWMIGTVAIRQEKFSEADRSIRAALPFLRGDSRMTSAALFYLGWANYRMGKLSDAIRFNKECTRVKGPYREHAERNLRVITAETASRN